MQKGWSLGIHEEPNRIAKLVKRTAPGDGTCRGFLPKHSLSHPCFPISTSLTSADRCTRTRWSSLQFRGWIRIPKQMAMKIVEFLLVCLPVPEKNRLLFSKSSSLMAVNFFPDFKLKVLFFGGVVLTSLFVKSFIWCCRKEERFGWKITELVKLNL